MHEVYSNQMNSTVSMMLFIYVPMEYSKYYIVVITGTSSRQSKTKKVYYQYGSITRANPHVKHQTLHRTELHMEFNGVHCHYGSNRKDRAASKIPNKAEWAGYY